MTVFNYIEMFNEFTMDGALLSNVFNIASMITWMFVFIPQILTNMKNKSASAISFYFLFCWLMGDLFSIQSASKLNLNKVIVYNGWLHVVFDVILISQWFYYNYQFYDNSNVSAETPLLLSYYQVNQPKIIKQNEFLLICGVIFQFITHFSMNEYDSNTLAVLVGWAATCVFFFSRIPQIYRNYTRKSVEGLSLMTFFLISIANNMFLTSVLVQIIDIDDDKKYKFLFDNLQWIVGILLSDAVDIIILFQFYKYKNHRI
jgi:uncharacterized protein with PQ loop repeat